MDIKLTPKPSVATWYIAILLLLAVLVVVTLSHSNAALQVAREDITLLKVEQGNVDIYNQAFGELYSAQERLLTSQAAGKVAEIHLRPGANVEPDSVIVSLVNPQLNERYQAARGRLASQTALLAAFELEQQNARLDYQGRIADIAAALERAQLELDVNTQLSQRGVSAKLDIQRAQLSVRQQTKKLDLEQQKYAHFVQMQALQLELQHIEHAQLEREVALLAQQVADLAITAGMHGTLQSLEVQIGESVPQGAALGRVGSSEALLTRLRIPQQQADRVKVGAPVKLSTRKGRFTGQINLIEPVVTQGVVLAEVGLTSELPADARPLAPVTGHIFIHTQEDALYVQPATGMRPLTHLKRFVVSGDTQQAHQRDILLGEFTEDKLIIQSGLKANDQVIVQMQDNWAAHAALAIDK